MKPEATIIISLLQKLAASMSSNNVYVEQREDFMHSKFGKIIFSIKIEKISIEGLPKQSVALVLDVISGNSRVSSRITVATKNQLQEKVQRYIVNPDPILNDLPNYYRSLFDYPRSTI